MLEVVRPVVGEGQFAIGHHALGVLRRITGETGGAGNLPRFRLGEVTGLYEPDLLGTNHGVGRG